MKVRANADTPADARQSLAFGADGIGLCRTEHMFFEEGRIVPMREMILADEQRAGVPRLPSSCRCSARTLSICSRSWPGSR